MTRSNKKSLRRRLSDLLRASGILRTRPRYAPAKRNGLLGTAGFTLIEMAFACEVIMLLSLIFYGETRRTKEHALVAACLSYQVALQRTLWGEFALNGEFPPDAQFGALLAKMPNSNLAKNFNYTRNPADVAEYYMRCGHDHSYVAVLFVDSGAYLPPKAIYNLAAARGP